MNLFKKFVASVALTVLVASIATTGVSAAASSDVEAANKLAAAGIINDHSSNTAAYNLGDNVLRQEIAKVAANVAGLSPKTTCGNSFSDVSATTPNNWACSYVEALLDNGLVSANATFRPEASISKSEALKMMLEAAGYEDIFSDVNMWQSQTVAFAVENGVIASSFSDYNTMATRGWIFRVASDARDAVAAVDEEDDFGDDLLGDLLGGLDFGDDETTDEETTDEETTDTPVFSGDNVLTVSLSPDTADSATVPASVNGLPVASFDFTAGAEDVTVTQLTVQRRGLSDAQTITALAVYTEEGRASNSKNDNQENDTQAQLNLNQGGVVVKAGQTRTITIVVDLGNAATAGQDEFALELVNVVANSNVEGVENLVANSMRVGSVDAPVLTFDNNGTSSNPTLGETEADIFEFQIEGDSNEDVVLKSVTFEGSSSAEDNLMNFQLVFGNDVIAETTYMNGDYLTFDLGDGLTIREDKNEDFTVKADVIAGAGDTIGFNIDEGLDITAMSTKFGYGAGVDITTNAVNVANAFGAITIEAGELTIVEVEPDYDQIREDKKNVILGGFRLTNVAGQNLELQDFGVRMEFTAGTTGFTQATQFLTDVELYNEETGSSYELTVNGTDDLDVVFSSNSVDVLIPQGVTEWAIRADTAETINNFDSASLTMSFSTGLVNTTSGGFYVEETEDDTQVTDITPSSITFNSLDGSEAGATASLSPLSDITVVRGAEDLVALQFEVEAEETSYVVVDEVIASVNPNTAGVVAVAASAVSATAGDLSATADAVGTAANGSTITIVTGGADTTGVVISGETATTITATVETDGAGAADPTWADVVTALNLGGVFGATVTSPVNGADTVVTADAQTMTLAGGVNAVPAVTTFGVGNLPNQSISAVKLYQGSVSESNLLEQVSGSNIAQNGTVTFNDFNDVMIAANATETFIVTLSLVDGIDVVNNSPLQTKLVSIDAEDDERDDVAVSGTFPFTSARDLTVTGFGVLTLTEDNGNEDNEDDKTVLAGSSEFVFSVDVQATNESMDVETVTFTVAGATALNNSITSASLYLDDTLIDTNANSDITNTSITFDDLTNLIVEEATSELRLKLNTNTIGYQKLGSTDAGIQITNVALTNVEGVSSGKDAASQTLAVTSKLTDIVPAVVTPSSAVSLTSNPTPQLKLTATVGDNTVDTSNSAANVVVNTITLSTLGTSSAIVGGLTYTLTNVDDSTDTHSIQVADGSNVVFNLLANLDADNRTISGGASETYKITITGTAEGDTVSLQLLENGVNYDVAGNLGATGLTTNMTSELDLGSRSY